MILNFLPSSALAHATPKTGLYLYGQRSIRYHRRDFALTMMNILFRGFQVVWWTDTVVALSSRSKWLVYTPGPVSTGMGDSSRV